MTDISANRFSGQAVGADPIRANPRSPPKYQWNLLPTTSCNCRIFGRI